MIVKLLNGLFKIVSVVNTLERLYIVIMVTVSIVKRV